MYYCRDHFCASLSKSRHLRGSIRRYFQCYIYIKTEKNGNSYFFTQLHLVSKKMRFSKIANLANAPAIHNLKMVLKTFQIPSTQSLCSSSLVRACFPSSSQQSPHTVFASSEPVLPPAAHRALCYFQCYISKRRKKRKFVIVFFVQLQLVSKKNAVLENCKISKRARNT